MSLFRYVRAAGLCLALCTIPLLSSCGGQSGGIPSGIGGALINANLNTNVGVLNLGSGATTLFDGSISGLGKDSNGNPLKSFEIVLKGAGVQGNDVIYVYNVADDPPVKTDATYGGVFVDQAALQALGAGYNYNDGAPLYEAFSSTGPINGPDGKPFLVFEDGGNFYFAADRSSADESVVDHAGTQVTTTEYPTFDGAIPDGATYTHQVPVFRYLSKTAQPMVNSGQFDVQIDFFTDQITPGIHFAKQVSPAVAIPVSTAVPFWRVLLKEKGSVHKGTVYVAPLSSGDPTLNFSQATNIHLTVNDMPPLPTNISGGSYYLRVRVGEQAVLQNNQSVSDAAIYESLTQVTVANNTTTVDVPIVNRLRPFNTIQAEAVIANSSGTAVPLASGADSSVSDATPLVIGVDHLSTDSSIDVQSRIASGGSISITPNTFIWPADNSQQTNSAAVTAVLQNLVDLDGSSGSTETVLLPNEFLNFSLGTIVPEDNSQTFPSNTMAVDTSGVVTFYPANAPAAGNFSIPINAEIKGDATADLTGTATYYVKVVVSTGNSATVSWTGSPDWAANLNSGSFVAQLHDTDHNKFLPSDTVSAASDTSASVPIDQGYANDHFKPVVYAWSNEAGGGVALAAAKSNLDPQTLTDASFAYSASFAAGSGVDYVASIDDVKVDNRSLPHAIPIFQSISGNKKSVTLNTVRGMKVGDTIHFETSNLVGVISSINTSTATLTLEHALASNPTVSEVVADTNMAVDQGDTRTPFYMLTLQNSGPSGNGSVSLTGDVKSILNLTDNSYLSFASDGTVTALDIGGSEANVYRPITLTYKSPVGATVTPLTVYILVRANEGSGTGTVN